MLVHHIRHLALGVVQLTAHLGAHCVSVFMVDLSRPCLNYHFLFWGTSRLFPANFTVYKPLLSVCVCFHVYGQLCLRGEVSGEFTVHVPFWICWASPAYPHFREVVPIDVSLHFYLIRYCVLELGDLSMWEVKILLHYSFALYFYWVVYLLIFKSPLYIKEINSVICATNTFLFVLGL